MNHEKYYAVTVLCGHVGAGRSVEITRYFKDYDILSAYFSAKYAPRSKKSPTCVKEVRQISFEEYCEGKLREQMNPYLNTFKYA